MPEKPCTIFALASHRSFCRAGACSRRKALCHLCHGFAPCSVGSRSSIFGFTPATTPRTIFALALHSSHAILLRCFVCHPTQRREQAPALPKGFVPSLPRLRTIFIVGATTGRPKATHLAKPTGRPMVAPTGFAAKPCTIFATTSYNSIVGLRSKDLIIDRPKNVPNKKSIPFFLKRKEGDFR